MTSGEGCLDYGARDDCDLIGLAGLRLALALVCSRFESGQFDYGSRDYGSIRPDSLSQARILSVVTNYEKQIFLALRYFLWNTRYSKRI
ncbi:hypothetical protein SAMN05421736_1011 [Evansella caseinilytica]|uniref:Uncharacterized protein n=1 Tax=Evansella caseinilytica TaxID=1503961 RepID=A0A1H3FZG8_9BACI|nr:hypothetical protein SAMN05421736_1011 [Evansella caseinilytica]